jgi:hypothetical protein
MTTNPPNDSVKRAQRTRRLLSASGWEVSDWVFGYFTPTRLVLVSRTRFLKGRYTVTTIKKCMTIGAESAMHHARLTGAKTENSLLKSLQI